MTRVSPVNNTVNQCFSIKILQMTSAQKNNSMISSQCSTIIIRYCYVVLPSPLLLFPTSDPVSAGQPPIMTPKDTKIVWCPGFWTDITWHGRLRATSTGRRHIATQTVRRRSRRRTFITCRTTWFSLVCKWPETELSSCPRDISTSIFDNIIVVDTSCVEKLRRVYPPAIIDIWLRRMFVQLLTNTRPWLPMTYLQQLFYTSVWFNMTFHHCLTMF